MPSEEMDRQATRVRVRTELIRRIKTVSDLSFDVLALDIYRFQYTYNQVYRQFCDLIGRTPDFVTSATAIPCLPIRFFKSHDVVSGHFNPDVTFESSTTTGQIPSRHSVGSLSLYDEVATRGFESLTRKPIDRFTWLGLLPSYLERPNASLVHMVRRFVRTGGGGFFMDDLKALRDRITRLEASGKPTILIGVSFALLEFAEQFPQKLRHTMVIETGGMKGRREEITRVELHRRLASAFDLDFVCSEYGMTELLSQAWSFGDGLFRCAPTMRVRIRQLSDPLTYCRTGERGAINCFDLANIDSCAFIATDDAGVVYSEGAFEVLGRLDGSEQRGCNLMFTERIGGGQSTV